MMSFEIARRWLTVAGLAMALLGLGLAFAPRSAPLAPLHERIDRAIFATTEIGPAVRHYQRWINAVLGGSLVGYGLTFAILAHHGLGERRRWAWNALAGGFGAWFVIDTGLSLWWGVTLNALLNVGAMAATLPPLVAARRHTS